jgi:Leucine-rich repeat (LRR) protein
MSSSSGRAVESGKVTHENAEEAKHKIQGYEGYLSATAFQPCGERKQPRAVAISFSSPLVSHIVYQDDPSFVESDSRPLPNSAEQYSQSSNQSEGKSPHCPPHSTSLRVSSRPSSFEARLFKGRPISRIDERNEDCTNELSVVQRDSHPVIPTPGNEGAVMLTLHPNVDTSYSFHLSSLAAFSLNQIDEPMPREVSWVAQRTHPNSLRQVHGGLVLATEELIKHLTDAEPYEIYWDHLRRLDLQNKGLVTLHRLNDYCCRLEELNVSDNSIGQLCGVPSSIRTLKIPRNCLSNLTAWGHLSNLQYLDVSSNDLESLDGLCELIHLRNLKANDNKVKNLAGVFGLSGLLSLKMRNNLLTSVDFAAADL